MAINQAPACPGGTLYTIRPGDTLFALAGRFNITVAALIAANPGINPQNLQVGQVICIPGAPGPAPCPGGTFYTIQPGDTLFLIARRFGIPLEALVAANPGLDPLRLQVGQQLCIPRAAPPPFPPCCFILTPTVTFPPTTVPFPPAGTLLVVDAGPGFTAITFAVSGLPEPEALGPFDAYEGRLFIPLPGEPAIFGVILTRATVFEQPVIWAGSRIIQERLTEGSGAAINPFNIETGLITNPVLQGPVEPCR